jgi:hypothetical protein
LVPKPEKVDDFISATGFEAERTRRPIHPIPVTSFGFTAGQSLIIYIFVEANLHRGESIR